MKHREILVLDPQAGGGEALARALADTYPAWTVVSKDPAAAVPLLGAGRVEVVVPIMANDGHGAALLEWLRRHYPSVAHVAADLSGPVSAAGSGGVSPTELAQSVGRRLVVSGRLRNPQLAVFASKLGRIPVLSSVYREIRRMLAAGLADGDAFSLSDVAELVGRDPGMAVKVLKTVNSPLFGLRHPVSSLPQAVALLGARRISSLVLGVSLSDQFQTSGKAGYAVETEWVSALLTAQLSRRIYRSEGASSEDSEVAYLAGLLHNVGRLLLAANLSDEFIDVEWPVGTLDKLRIERSQLGAAHTDLGALLVGFWGLDEHIGESVAFYADPSQAASRGFSPVAAVHAAVALLGRGRLDCDARFMAEAGLSDKFEKWARLDDVRHLLAAAS